MPRRAPAGGCERGNIRPVRHVSRSIEPGGDGTNCAIKLRSAHAASGLLQQRRRRLSEGAGVDLLGERENAAVLIHLNGRADAAAAGRRPTLGRAVLALQ